MTRPTTTLHRFARQEGSPAIWAAFLSHGEQETAFLGCWCSKRVPTP